MAIRPPTTSLLRLAEADNIAVATTRIEPGQVLTHAGRPLPAYDAIPVGHKIALQPIRRGDKVLKWGCPIGSATCDIRPGELVHTHNLKSDYLPTLEMEI